MAVATESKANHSSSESPPVAASWELQPLVTGLCHFIAHDLGNAISALTITLDLLSGHEDLPQRSRELVQRAISLESRLQALAESLGALGGARFRPQSLDVKARLEAILKPLKLRERFRVEVDVEDLPEWQSPAPRLFELCLRLLLRNAAEATPAGARLGIHARVAGGNLHLTVWDEGSGVAPELRDKLFRDVFSTKGSNGVALLLVRSAVEGCLRGRVSYAPNEPQGSRFTLEVPA